MMGARHLILAITGASGSIYGLRLGAELLKSGARVALLVSRAGAGVLKEETGIDWSGDHATMEGAIRGYYGVASEQLACFDVNDLTAAVASGSSAADAMIVCPCSMGSLSRIACGNSGNLIERCADVMLKEGRPLVLVPRETPLNAIHLENMLKLARVGARIVPAMPGFYHRPESLDDLVNFLVGKVMDTLGIEHTLYRRWGTGTNSHE